MRLFDSPLLHQLRDARRILIAGAGGGYDVFNGLPLFFALRECGKEVFLANHSFTRLERSDASPVSPGLYEVTADTSGQSDYFPEMYLARYLRRCGIETSIHCFERSAVAPLTRAYEALAARLQPDAVVLVDGGTDSLMRGDEAGLGTPEEDVASLCAVDRLDVPIKLLACVGFGVDTFHGVCHTDFLEAVAALARGNAFLGVASLTASMPEFLAFQAACVETFRSMPRYPSIVCSSIMGAVEGHFGDYHMTKRTEGSELFINPLMSLYWVFQLGAVVRRNLYVDRVRHTEHMLELSAIIETFRASHAPIKKWRELPM